jgi:hypothetical protein
MGETTQYTEAKNMLRSLMDVSLNPRLPSFWTRLILDVFRRLLEILACSGR